VAYTIKVFTVEDLLQEIIIIGDRVLIKPKKDPEKTAGGLYLPPGVQEKEKIQQGYVVKTGPGYPIPAIVEEAEPWKEPSENIRYIPLQARPGDLALFLYKSAYELYYQGEKYFILPQSSILMLERQQDLFA